MKRRMLTSAAGVFCFCACVVFANKLLAQTPAQKLQNLSRALNLTPEQKGKLLPILEQEWPKLQAIRSNPNLTGAQKAMQLRAVHGESDPQIKSILSAQQYEQWQTIRQQEIEQAIQKKTEAPK